MKFSNVKTVSQYNTLLQNLNPVGKYQMRIFGICILYWFVSGVLTTMFQITFKRQICSHSLLIFQIIGVLMLSWVANLKGRKVANFVSNVFTLIGFVVLLMTTIKAIRSEFATIGFSIIGFSIYTQPIFLLTIVCQLTVMRAIEVVFCLSLCFYCIARISVLPLISIVESIDQQNSNLYVTLLILGPACLFSFIPNFFIYDSPRYFIEKNINKAEQLIKKITYINTGKQSEIQIDENFILKRIHVRKYNYLTLWKFHSLGFSQYCTLIVLMLLGIIGQQSKYIFKSKTQISDPRIQVMWIGGFQVIGIIASIFFLKFCKRKLTCLLTSFAAAIISTLLYWVSGSSPFFNLVLLGLNAVFSISLFIFLLINCIQLYPHSIRTLGLGMMLACYYLGQELFYSYLQIEHKVESILQLFLMGSWIMFFHCFGQCQTINKGLSYEIKQIQEQQNEQRYAEQ